MTIDELRSRWHKLFVIDDNERDYPLACFIKDCLGTHKNGVLFMGEDPRRFIKEKKIPNEPFAELETIVLRCDEENNLFLKVADVGKDSDWELLGLIIDPDIDLGLF